MLFRHWMARARYLRDSGVVSVASLAETSVRVDRMPLVYRKYPGEIGLRDGAAAAD